MQARSSRDRAARPALSHRPRARNRTRSASGRLPPVVLTIAVSDSSAGAGIQADLKAIAATGGYGASVITAITAQNTRAVTAAAEVGLDLIRAQIDAVFSDLSVAAVKTGMLSSRPVIETVAVALRDYHPPHYVLDPVMISKTGFPLLRADAVDALRQALLPLATLVTPNVHEARALTGIAVETPGEAEAAGRRLVEAGAAAVLVKGGHLREGPATDVLVTREGVRVFAGDFIEARHTHGTGCTYSAAIATYLARGLGLIEAIARAKTYITEAIRGGLAIGHGVGPTDHFFFLRRRDGHRWLRRLRVDVGKAQSDGPNGQGRGRSALTWWGGLGVERQAALPPSLGEGWRTASVREVGRLHVITDETLQGRFSHVELARRAAAGGADVVQFREKRAWTTRELVHTARDMVTALAEMPARLVVDDRVDVTLAAGADAVHLGRDDLDAALARRLLGQGALIGGTANSVEEARRVAGTAVDYLGVGPVFGTRSKANPAPTLGLDGLAAIVQAVDTPVIAIGSVTAERVLEILRAGAYGVAVLSGIVCRSDPTAATAEFRRIIDACLAGAVP